MVSLNEFVTFAAVADCHSFTVAAKALRISKSLASRHVADLEQTLGVKLLHRTTRKLGLTPAGVLFHQRCQELIAQADAARNEVGLFRTSAVGTVKINAAISFGRLHLIPAIAEFMSQHPDVSIELELSEHFADLITGGVDVVLRQADETKLNVLVARKLAPIRWLVCASPEYLAAHSCPMTPDDLQHHNCIVYVSNLKSEWYFNGPLGAQLVKVKGNYKANNADGVCGAVLAHIGIAVMPSFAASHLIREGRIIQVLKDFQLPERMLYAAYLPNPTMAQSLQLFVKFLADRFGEQPYWDDCMNSPASLAA